LTSDEVQQRLLRYGSNLLKPKKKSDALTLLFAQFKSPIILILIFAAGLSFFLRDPMDATIILVIVLVSGFLGFWQERGAANAVEKLYAIVQIKTTVVRNGDSEEVPIEEVVPGDIVFIKASDVIPGDCLPLLPKQILLTNLLTDFPEMTIATDSVDRELVEKPRRWNIQFIRNFMLTFGILSSAFDYLTFGVLLLLLHATTDQFRTGWFLESVISASATVLVIRTRKSFFRSKPGKYLLIATLLIVVVTVLFPFTPLADLLGFRPLPLTMLLVIGMIVVLYIIAAEIVKRSFYKRVIF